VRDPLAEVLFQLDKRPLLIRSLTACGAISRFGEHAATDRVPDPPRRKASNLESACTKFPTVTARQPGTAVAPHGCSFISQA
jgi:hypothetical protein